MRYLQWAVPSCQPYILHICLHRMQKNKLQNAKQYVNRASIYLKSIYHRRMAVATLLRNNNRHHGAMRAWTDIWTRVVI